MGKMKELVYTVYEDKNVCILHVSGQVSSIDQVVDWVGGFICPKQDDSQQFCNMSTMPAGGVDGDIIVFLCDDLYFLRHNSYAAVIEEYISNNVEVEE